MGKLAGTFAFLERLRYIEWGEFFVVNENTSIEATVSLKNANIQGG
jgi:hypothetical protein